MEKNKRISIFLFCFMILFCGFLFTACDNVKIPTDETEVTPTDDGSLNHEASCDTNTQYTIEDLYNILGEQSLEVFSRFNGFRFTYVVNSNSGHKEINGITTSEGMNFSFFDNTSGSIDSKVITVKDGKLYTRENNIDSETKEVIKRYRQTNENKFNLLKSYLTEAGFETFYFSPKDIIEIFDEENLSFNIIRREEVFMISILKNNEFQGTVYLNFDSDNYLTAIKYNDIKSSTRVTLSGFNGKIAFPDLENYVEE